MNGVDRGEQVLGKLIRLILMNGRVNEGGWWFIDNDCFIHHLPICEALVRYTNDRMSTHTQ